MGNQFFEDENYHHEDYTNTPLKEGDYEVCSFTNCNFSNTNLAANKFIECDFIDCDLSNALLNKTAFQDCSFTNCKMLGLNFEKCESFGFSIKATHCNLSHSIFYNLKIPNTDFQYSKLQNVDFSEAILVKANFQDCDLQNAIFQNTNLESADFRGAMNYSINPEDNKIAGAKFSLSEVRGLLDKYNIKID
ncbi:pentapeptide repeat-containing protein [Gramella sp. AN32]|uniref:Pentapeptide repeat-containing protein n=1 Tax=Christiangramia antarctica TaxID=2058158 RepID=A0ABW5X826_9FLAO|nr:pentapeptide repeat-containing protein [Gramella sp. AN32]MCM4158193.1 hypothetical protein [Gramella sp. AN32]